MDKADFKNRLEEIPKPLILQQSKPQIKQPSFDVDKIWKAVKEQLRLYISKRDFKAWFNDVYLEKIENGIAEISCSQSYQREWIETYHRPLLRKSLAETTGQNLEVIISIRSLLQPITNSTEKYQYYNPEEQGNSSTASSNENSLFSQQNDPGRVRDIAIKKAMLNPKYLFGNFIVGTNNRLAQAVAQAVSENPGRAYNPVFFYGGTGVGKTHLMQAIGNCLLDTDSTKKIVYCSIEHFLNELIEAIRTKKTDGFRQKYRGIDLLLIDDIQFISNKVSTQEELFHTFNTLYQSNKQIVIASDRPPKEINNLPERLRSRFEGGMVVDIQAPEYETRIAILKQRLIEQNSSLPDNVIEIIATNIESNVRELEGAVTKVVSVIKLTGKIPDEDEIARMLQVDVQSKRKKIKPEKVIEVIGEVFDLSPREIKGKRRTAYVAMARQVVMFLLRDILEYPLERVAREVNRKDHTTVLHACNKVESLVKKDPRFKEKIEKCKRMLEE